VAEEEELGRSVMEQALDLWINPEIERRLEAGSLPEDFVLTRAQIIMNLDAEAPEIRLNKEIKAVARFRSTRAIEAGEKITEADVESIEDIMLTDQDPNAGHLTMMLFTGRWKLAFDFRYNAARIAGAIDAAREFLDVASLALEQGHLRAFVDTLFSATELLAKGHLLTYPDEALLRSKRHTIVFSRFNQEGNLGNVEPRFVELLNRLQALRGSARYLDNDFSLSAEEAREMLSTGKYMFETLRETVPQHYKTGNES
jgi:uncharacterized protein (UPF0332 family)